MSAEPNDALAADVLAATEMQRNRAQSQLALAIAHNARLRRENEALKRELQSLREKVRQ